MNVGYIKLDGKIRDPSALFPLSILLPSFLRQHVRDKMLNIPTRRRRRRRPGYIEIPPDDDEGGPHTAKLFSKGKAVISLGLLLLLRLSLFTFRSRC